MQLTENQESDLNGPATGVAPPFGGWVMPVLLLTIVVLFNWKLLLTRQFTWLEDPDLADQILPWFQFQAFQWHGFHIPAWDPNVWTGQPLFGQTQPGSAYPFNWLLFLMPLKNGQIRMAALNWYYVLIRYLGRSRVTRFAAI